MIQPQDPAALKAAELTTAFAGLEKQFNAIIDQDDIATTVASIDIPTNESIADQDIVPHQYVFTLVGDGKKSVFKITSLGDYKIEKFQLSAVNLTTYKYVQVFSQVFDNSNEVSSQFVNNGIEISIDPPPVDNIKVTITAYH